jgi:hypothetical protein
MNGVLFLDVDGVFNTSRCLLENYCEHDQSLLFVKDLCPQIAEFMVPLEKHQITNLKWIMEQFDLHFVISSTWRQRDEYKKFFLTALSTCGIDTSRYLGDTPCLGTDEGRGAEVKQWLEANPHVGKKFVILDDEHEYSFKKHGLQSHVVKTFLRSGIHHEEGLSKIKAEKVVDLLEKLEVRNVERMAREEENQDIDHHQQSQI